MANSRRPARRASHSGAGATRHLDWLRELDRALGVRFDPIINTSQLPAFDTEDPQADELGAISDSDIPIPRPPRPPPPPPPHGFSHPSTKSDPGYINPFDDTANFLDAFSDSGILIPCPPPPPTGSPPPGESKNDHDPDQGLINPFDDTAIWKTLEQYSSMQRMIRKLGEEVETRRQTILSLKDEHAAELRKVRNQHAAELQKTKEEHAVELKNVRGKELATLVLEVECLENENVELKNENVALKKKIHDEREWGVEKIEGMGYALEEMMFELENRMGDDKD